MEMIVRPCLRAKGTSSGSRSMVPSSPAISTIAPAGRSPASRARSTRGLGVAVADQDAAGLGAQREDVAGPHEVAGATARPTASSRRVVARSAAEMPVLTPCAAAASTETVKAVRIDSVLCSTICGSWSRSSSAPSMGAQIRPRHSLIMKATISGVAFSAAMTRSPSFSRSSSSTTTTGRPAAMSAMARSTGSRARSSASVAVLYQIGAALMPGLLPGRARGRAARERSHQSRRPHRTRAR